MSKRRRVALEDRKDRGPCRLCGVVGPLTKTHVPAWSAGNVGARQAAMIDIDDDCRRTYGLGRETYGGMWGYWFCATCNSDRTRPWNEEYSRWVPPIFRAIHNPQSSGDTLSAIFADLDPGAFARCVWAWFFATCKGLREQLPEVAAAVRTGEPVQPPARLPRVFLACTRDLQFSMMGGRFSTGITAPPFGAVLVDERTRYLVPSWFDVALWLPQRPGRRRDLSLTLPIVELIGEAGLPMIGQPVLE
jgi:hypothetical protein